MRSSSGHNVFIYGTITADEVLHALLKRIPQSSPAILNDYHRFRVKGEAYPCILPVEGDKVTGKVLTGISDVELSLLDTFETSAYERKTVEVTLVESSEKLQVETYVWSNKDDPNLYGEWDFEEWKVHHREEFVKMINGFMEGLEVPEAKQ